MGLIGRTKCQYFLKCAIKRFKNVYSINVSRGSYYQISLEFHNELVKETRSNSVNIMREMKQIQQDVNHRYAGRLLLKIM
jgi:hypothetical protein